MDTDIYVLLGLLLLSSGWTAFVILLHRYKTRVAELNRIVLSNAPVVFIGTPTNHGIFEIEPCDEYTSKTEVH